VEYLATFTSQYGALMAHKALTQAGIQAELLPVPRSLSSSCGICLSFCADSAECVHDAVDLEAIYRATSGTYTLI